MLKTNIESIHTYPYQNLDLEDLPNERWDDIPDFDGYYQISNYGRVKSLSREMMMGTPGGGSYFSKERIRRSRLDLKINTLINEPIYSLVVTLYRDSVQYSFSIARLVYYVFREPFDLNSLDILISYKDHDGRNIYLENLIKSNRKNVELLSFNENRSASQLSILSKPVTQFDALGYPVQTFSSMYEAGKVTGFRARNISSVVTGNDHMYKGFFGNLGFILVNLILERYIEVVQNNFFI